jgi:hypothetical protein
MLTVHLNRNETTGFGLTMMAQQPPTPTPEVASEERREMDSTSSGVRDFRKAKPLDLRTQEWEASLSLVYATIFTSLESTENARTSVFWVVRTMSFSRKRKSTIWFLVTSGIFHMWKNVGSGATKIKCKPSLPKERGQRRTYILAI